MEQLVYKKIVLYREEETRNFLDCLRLCPMHVDFAQKCIKSLYLGGALNVSTVMDILSLCNGITALALFVHTDAFIHNATSLYEALDALPLTSLTLSMATDFTNLMGRFIFSKILPILISTIIQCLRSHMQDSRPWSH
jgi:hypothetical protein